MKKIAYIELDTHAEIAQDFMDCMLGLSNISVDYYFTEKIKNQIIYHDETVHLSDSSRILDQLSVQNYDLVIIGTVHRYFSTFLAIVEQYKSAVIVHNVNFSRISKFKLVQNIIKKDPIYRLKLWWKEGLYNTPKVYNNANHLLVLDQEIVTERYQFLPLFFTKKYSHSVHEILQIVIPGGVSQARRDYHHVISKIKDLEQKLKKNGEGLLLEFIFLGKAKGEELKKIIDLDRNLEFINITYFTDRVSTSVFDEYMQKADVLWCPIQQETEFFSHKEVYGKTKMTGNLGDAIKYGKFAVFPSKYSSDLPFIVKEDKHIVAQFLNLKSRDFDFQKDFGQLKIQADLENSIMKMIST